MNKDTLSVDCFLVVNSAGSVRVLKNRPVVDFDEVSLGLKVELPRSLFRKPRLSATLIVPESAGTPDTIPVEVQNNVREAIEQATGLQVRLTTELPSGAGDV
jgi:hypothetical protein